MPGKNIIFTVGHSNRPIDAFLELLDENEIELLTDVRTVPRSATYPHFNKENLPGILGKHGIGYLHLPSLGGLRKRTKDAPHSHNTFWENASFRNYADYAETEAFRLGLHELTALARKQRTCYMCSEAVWWRCHRRIITDYLLAAGWQVKHIMGPDNVTDAEINEHAVINGDIITYPAEQGELEF